MKQWLKITGHFYTGLIFLFLYLPIGILILFSFNESKINTKWTGFTFKWYHQLVNNSDLLEALQNSLLIGLTSAFVATVIGTLTAYSFARSKFFTKGFFNSLIKVPIILPDIIAAIGLLSFYVAIKATLGLTTVWLAHVTFNIAFVFVIVSTRFTHFPRNLEAAALDLGATPLQVFIKVVLPQIFPGVIAAYLLAFTLSWDDFVISFFNSGAGATTLPVKVYSMIKFGVSPQVNAISTIIIFISIFVILIALRWRGVKNLY